MLLLPPSLVFLFTNLRKYWNRFCTNQNCKMLWDLEIVMIHHLKAERWWKCQQQWYRTFAHAASQGTAFKMNRCCATKSASIRLSCSRFGMDMGCFNGASCEAEETMIGVTDSWKWIYQIARCTEFPLDSSSLWLFKWKYFMEEAGKPMRQNAVGGMDCKVSSRIFSSPC